MGFWGDRNNLNGKLEEIIDLILSDNEELFVKMLPIQEKDKYGSPLLMLSDKPSEKCLDGIREMYRIRFFQNDNDSDNYKYLMAVETLRFAFEEDWHLSFGRTDEFPLSKAVTGNSWDLDGYFYITDGLDSYRRLLVIPFKRNEDFDSGHNLHRSDALKLTKNIVKKLNNGELKIE